jgi:hypothetical protein
VFHGSFFSNLNDPAKFIDFAYLYLNGMPQKCIQDQLAIGKGTAVNYKSIIQRLCADMNLRINTQLGGGEGGAVTEMDGTFLGT